MKWCLDCFMTYVWGFFIIGGCAYLVFWKGHSGWWFVPAILVGCTKCAVHRKEEESS